MGVLDESPLAQHIAVSLGRIVDATLSFWKLRFQVLETPRICMEYATVSQRLTAIAAAKLRTRVVTPRYHAKNNQKSLA